MPTFLPEEQADQFRQENAIGALSADFRDRLTQSAEAFAPPSGESLLGLSSDVPSTPPEAAPAAVEQPVPPLQATVPPPSAPAPGASAPTANLNAGTVYTAAGAYGPDAQDSTPVRQRPAGDLVTNQFNAGLSYDEALAACGPVAAQALARAYGNSIPLDAVMAAAKRNGWNTAGGMNGVTNQKRLLDELGIPARLDANPDWGSIARDAQGGNPVIISTTKHYYVAQDYDPQTGRFFVGESGKAFKSGGGAWMTAAEIASQGGGVNGALFADAPTSPTPSVAARPAPSTPQDFLADFSGKVSGAAASPSPSGGEAKDGIQQGVERIAGPALKTAGDFLGDFTGRLGQSLQQVDQELQQAQSRPLSEQNAQSGVYDVPVVGGIARASDAFGQAQDTALKGAGDVVRPFLTNPAEQDRQSIRDQQRYGMDVSPAMYDQAEKSTTDETLNIGLMSTPMAGADKLGKVATTVATDAAHGLTINLSKYPEAVRTIIEDAYAAIPKVMDEARRGVVPDEVVRDLAAQTGTSVATITAKWQPGQAQNAETILALREGLGGAARKVLDAQEALRANPTSADALNAFAESLTTHAALQEVVTGVTAEAGRALRQFRQPVTGQQFALQQLQKLAAAAKMTPEEFAGHIAGADLSDPAAVANLARTLTQHSFGDKLTALWYFDLLSSPVTHIKNTVSNALTAAARPIESAVAGAFEEARTLGGRRGVPERRIGEAPSQVVGMLAGVPDGVRAAYQILRRGATDLELTAKPELAGKEPFQGRVADLTVNAPGRALRAADVLFRSVNHSATLYGDAYRMARNEGVQGQALVDRVAELVKNPTPEMLKRAETQAAYRVFQQDGDFVRWASQGRDKAPVLRFVVPFIQTPYNITKYALERTPLALGGIANDLRKGAIQQKGWGDFADRLSRMTLGSATMYALYQYADQGSLTGAAPRDPAARDAFFRQGKQPYSFKGPDGNWYSYQAFQPFSTVFAAAAAAAEARTAGRDADALTLSALASLAVARSTLDQPWTDGLSEFLDFMSGANVRQPGDLLRTARDYSERQAASVVPAIARFIERAGDPIVRDPEGPIEAIKAGLPGLADSVPAKLDAFGKPSRRPADQQGLLGALNPARPSAPSTDPVERELARLQLKGFSVEPGFVGKNVTAFHTPVQLTREQQRQYQERSGVLTYALLAELIASDGWTAAPDARKAQLVDRVTTRVRDYVREQLEPALLDQAITERVKQARQRVSAP